MDYTADTQTLLNVFVPLPELLAGFGNKLIVIHLAERGYIAIQKIWCA
jgi:hypothetical protein